jgi:hypothetical protein
MKPRCPANLEVRGGERFVGVTVPDVRRGANEADEGVQTGLIESAGIAVTEDGPPAERKPR